MARLRLLPISCTAQAARGLLPLCVTIITRGRCSDSDSGGARRQSRLSPPWSGCGGGQPALELRTGMPLILGVQERGVRHPCAELQAMPLSYRSTGAVCWGGDANAIYPWSLTVGCVLK